MPCGESCRPFESTDDCDAAAWWPDRAGERLITEPLRWRGEMGGEDELRGGELGAPPEWDTDATSAEARPVVLRFEGGCAAVVVVVELRRHSRRLRPLAVEAMLTESESRTWSGERKCVWDSG